LHRLAQLLLGSSKSFVKEILQGLDFSEHFLLLHKHHKPEKVLAFSWRRRSLQDGKLLVTDPATHLGWIAALLAQV
jgi:hypothetical protein